MVQAGVLAGELGDVSRSRQWAASAARSGSPTGMYNLAVSCLEAGDRRAAGSSFQQAAEAGNSWGYAALIEMAEQDGDPAAAQWWAARGAEVDNPRCLQLHATNLLRRDQSQVHLALSLFEKAAGLGNRDAMVQAGIVCHHLGDNGRSQHWLTKAQDAGDTDAINIMRKYGLA